MQGGPAAAPSEALASRNMASSVNFVNFGTPCRRRAAWIGRSPAGAGRWRRAQAGLSLAQMGR